VSPVKTKCVVCGKFPTLCASELGVCLHCIRRRPQAALEHAKQAHQRSRAQFGLPVSPPATEGGVVCGLCARDCRIGPDERGFCGLREVEDGRLVHRAGTPKRGLLHWYRDPLPTNCVADWVCSGHTKYGKHNLAVFYASCTFNCLFCQNWHFRRVDPKLDRQNSTVAITARELADCANPRTYCVCFFGGDPSSQMPHALASGRALAERDILVCWETAGTMHPRFLNRALMLSMESGGCIKFDLKAFDENLHLALTGASNKRTLENFRVAAQQAKQRPDPALVVASTLLVPGYVDAEEVGRIARYIAELNPDIPYALLAFYPNFYIHDLPTTTLEHAHEAQAAALEAGLNNVRIGNRHLLSAGYNFL
jgi:pyruvate formate lyase activating enzyme